jgi:hypothetical protein
VGMDDDAVQGYYPYDPFFDKICYGMVSDVLPPHKDRNPPGRSDNMGLHGRGRISPSI